MLRDSINSAERSPLLERIESNSVISFDRIPHLRTLRFISRASFRHDWTKRYKLPYPSARYTDLCYGSGREHGSLRQFVRLDHEWRRGDRRQITFELYPPSCEEVDILEWFLSGHKREPGQADRYCSSFRTLPLLLLLRSFDVAFRNGEVTTSIVKGLIRLAGTGSGDARRIRNVSLVRKTRKKNYSLTKVEVCEVMAFDNPGLGSPSKRRLCFQQS